MEEYSNSIQDLPTDTLIEVLSRLPLKTRVQLSCVCKFWKDLISSNRIFIRSSRKLLMYSVSVGRSTSTIPSLESFMKADENCLSKPFNLGPGFYLVGCINGVFCFHHYWSCDLYLWNPVLHQFRRLPRSSNRSDPFNNIVVAFFSEPTNDDYIVVKIFLKYSEVHIYKLSSNSWNMYPSGISVHIKDMVALVHDGALHWLSNPYRYDMLFLNVYDLSTKRFQETLLSNLIPIDPYFPDLGLIKGCISLFGRSTVDDKYEVWMMREYGIENSWTKQFEFPRYIIPKNCLPGTRTSGKFVLTTPENFIVLYDPETEETEFPQNQAILYDIFTNFFFIDNYVESLVSVFPANRSSFLKRLFCLFS